MVEIVEHLLLHWELFLEDNGIKSRYVLYTDYDDDNNTLSVSDLINYECKVYHVALYANGNLYDGDGIINDNHILNWIEQEYNDDEVSITNFPFSDQKVKTLIRNDTDWDIDSNTFYNFMAETNK